MKILLVHSDFIEYEAKKKAIPSAEEAGREKVRVEECLVAFCSSEEGDGEGIVGKAVAEIKDVAQKVEAKRIVVYPFVHLTASPSKPQTALQLLRGIEAGLKKEGYEVHRSPFGWYKAFTLKCKGHPLSELSREVREGVEQKKKRHAGKIVLDRRNLQPNDHRILGEEMRIFHLSDDIGAGLPLWLPNGETIRHSLMQFMRETEEKYGYRYVSTPHITRGQMYEKTGHLPYYRDSMYSPLDIEGEDYYLKPMNCPHHHVIFSRLASSYRDLPLRLAEPGMTYRNELSGVTYGLIRVKCFTQNDAHIYVAPEQLREEFLGVLKLFRDVYETIGIKDYWFRLSLPDFRNNPEKYIGNPKEWEHACGEISAAMKDFGVKFVEGVGEAAFYGPKIDVQIRNVQGKEETIATSQVDIVVPKRLGLTYIGSDGNKKTPIVIHRAILGAYERFIAYLLEQTRGVLPLWLAPVQVMVIAVADRNAEFAGGIHKKLLDAGIRGRVDARSHTVQYKIREAQLAKIPYVVVIGDKEEQNNSLAVRTPDGRIKYGMLISDFVSSLVEQIKGKK